MTPVLAPRAGTGGARWLYGCLLQLQSAHACSAGGGPPQCAIAVVAAAVAVAFAAYLHQSTHARAAQEEGPRNVLGGPLQCCCTSPMTGYYR